MSTLLRSALTILCGAAIALSSQSLEAQQAPGPPGADAALGDRPAQGARANSKFSRMGTSVGQNPSRSKSKFEDLLENKDLSKFRGYKDEAIGEGWTIDGKFLHFDGTKSGDIVTRETYDNFDLQFDWKVTDGGNSGVMYRVSLGDSAPYLTGPEYQVLDDAVHKDGKNALTSAGSLYGLYAPSEDKKQRDAGIWNKARIVVQGSKVTHYLNGRKTIEAEIDSADWKERVANSKFKSWEKFAKNESGHIAFQDHGNEVWFRNIKIKRLDAEAGSTKRTASGNSKLRKMMQSAGGVGGPSESAGGGKASNRKSTKQSGKSKLEQMRANGPGSAGGGRTPNAPGAPGG